MAPATAPETTAGPSDASASRPVRNCSRSWPNTTARCSCRARADRRVQPTSAGSRSVRAATCSRSLAACAPRAYPPGCDIALAAEDALFGLPEVNFGHFPAGDTTSVMTEHLQPKHGLYYALTGKMMTAQEAERIGLISKAVPKSELNREVAELALSLREKSPLGLKAVKEAWYYSSYAAPDVAYEISNLISQLTIRDHGGRPTPGSSGRAPVPPAGSPAWRSSVGMHAKGCSPIARPFPACRSRARWRGCGRPSTWCGARSHVGTGGAPGRAVRQPGAPLPALIRSSRRRS